VTNVTVARIHNALRSTTEKNATSAIATSSTDATVSRISFCGTRSAATPATSVGITTPNALAVITMER
jgi:hypothetical protein